MEQHQAPLFYFVLRYAGDEHAAKEIVRLGKPYREAAVFEKAYLIHLLQDMIELGVAMDHVDTPGEYMEIDTQQDFELAQIHWKPRPS